MNQRIQQETAQVADPSSDGYKQLREIIVGKSRDRVEIIIGSMGLIANNPLDKKGMHTNDRNRLLLALFSTPERLPELLNNSSMATYLQNLQQLGLITCNKQEGAAYITETGITHIIKGVNGYNENNESSSQTFNIGYIEKTVDKPKTGMIL